VVYGRKSLVYEPKRRRTAFLFGRMSATTSEIVLIETSAQGPIPGPWSLRVLTRPIQQLRLVRA